MSLTVLHGDCRETLAQVPSGSVHCCVTSPPYWGLRSYLTKGHQHKHLEIGQEPTPEKYVETMVGVFREVRRCLHDSGTLWLNVGDSYNTNSGGNWGAQYREGRSYAEQAVTPYKGMKSDTLKPKDLCGIPWRLVLALQADGWYWRSCIVWHKKSCMPESVTDRPTNSWEPIFLLAKSQRYFYDAEAVKEKVGEPTRRAATFRNGGDYTGGNSFDNSHKKEKDSHGDGEESLGGRNQRNVWSLSPEPYSEAHFATFPTEIPRRAILAGTSARGCCPKCYAPWERQIETKPMVIARSGRSDATGCRTNPSGTMVSPAESRTIGWRPTCKCNAGEPVACTVLDPFGGSGTTGAVAIELGRKAILCELNDAYLPLIDKRTQVTKGLALA